MTTNHRPIGHLLRVLGLAFGVAVVVGGTIGQGIFRTPGIVAAHAPAPMLMLGLWALGGVLVAIDACAMVELSASVRQAGGPYVYIGRAFGRVARSVAGWADYLVWILAIAFISVVFSEYLHELGVARGVPGGVLAAGLIVACWALNLGGARSSGATQTLFSAIKGAMLVGLIVALFAWRGETGAEVAAPVAVAGVPATAVGVLALAGAMRAIVNTYSGWWSSAYFNEEVKQPRDLVRATFGGILAITAIYVLVNAALLHVLSPVEMAATKLPAAAAATRALGPAGGMVMTAMAIFSVVAICNLVMMLVGRIGYGMARDRVLPRALMQVSAKGTPQVAMSVAAALAIVAALSGTYETLIALTVPISVAGIGVVDLAAIRLRRREPELERPFRMPLFPLPAVIGFLINTGLLVAMAVEDPAHTVTGIGAAGALGIGYALFGKFERKDSLRAAAAQSRR
jgi:APA family basic amino acid/polyamine antiporter